MNPNLPWYWDSEKVDTKPVECLCEKSAVILDRSSLGLHFHEELSVRCHMPRSRLKQMAKGVTQPIQRGSCADWQCPSARSLLAWSTRSKCSIDCKNSELGKLKSWNKRPVWKALDLSCPWWTIKFQPPFFLMRELVLLLVTFPEFTEQQLLFRVIWGSSGNSIQEWRLH